MNHAMDYFHHLVGFLIIVVKNECRDVVEEMASWVKAWAQNATDLGVISLTEVNGTCLLNVRCIVNSMVKVNFPKIWNAHEAID